VIAHGGLADRSVDDGIYFLPYAQGAPPFRVFCGGWGFHIDLMRPHALYRVVTSSHFSDNGIVIVGVKPSAIADLPARFGVEGRVIENDLALVSGLEFLRALAGFDDGQHFTVVGARLAIALEVGFRKLLVGGVGGLLGCAFPGGAGALALLLHSTVETLLIEVYSLVTRRILHEIQGHAESVVKPEREPSGIGWLFANLS
jgi:hypothetical protein